MTATLSDINSLQALLDLLEAINDYEKGGLKMIDIECMIKSLRLAWLKRIFSSSRGTWESYNVSVSSSSEIRRTLPF